MRKDLRHEAKSNKKIGNKFYSMLITPDITNFL